MQTDAGKKLFLCQIFPKSVALSPSSLRCYAAVYLETQHDHSFCLSPGAESKITFTHGVLMCLHGKCVFHYQKSEIKTESQVYYEESEASADKKIGSGSIGNWGPSGAITGFRNVCIHVCVCMCVYGGFGGGGCLTADLSSGCAQTVCVFFKRRSHPVVGKPNTVCAPRC